MKPPGTSLAEHQRKYTHAIQQARRNGGEAGFQAWFNRETTATLQQGVVRGYWDFSLHILTPQVCAYLSNPEQKIALEIGCGGGRIMNAACSYFREVIGIDIHAEQQAVAAFLASQQKQNFRLLRTPGDRIGVPDASIDFIYSFIVLQHLPAFSVFVCYLHEVYRCLKAGGVAQLYFGKFARLHPLYQLRYFWPGYRERPGAQANQISLVVRPGRVRTLCRQIGLAVVGCGSSFYRVPDGYASQPGGQNFVTLVKER